MNGTPNTLGRALRGFFSDQLPRVRGASCQTVQSYRDTFVLLLRFIAAQRPTSVTKLDLEDLGPQVVLNFLHYLEVERHNIPATRNVRLAAIHAFFRYCAAEHPDRMELCQRILAVPFKSSARDPVPSSISNLTRFRLCSPQLIGTLLTVVAITRSSQQCSIPVREFRKS
jgi:hypothetical protein